MSRRALTIEQLRELAKSVGFADDQLDTAAAVALAESGGDPLALNVVTNPAPGFLPERSVGLWQINTLAHPEYKEPALYDPAENARAAFVISHGGTNWSHWTTYNLPASDPKSYLRYMPTRGAPT